MTPKAKRKSEAPVLMMNSEVLRRIRQHARSQSKTEVCGVLIGNEYGGKLKIEASIPGANAAQGGTHVTFTQDTWEHIYKIKDRDYPDERILGWYHSHPGFGVFLSDHDTFIHQNFFSSPQQVAWVYDPHTDEEGCFGWVNGRLERLSELAVSDGRGGELAGETGKPEPAGFDLEEDHPVESEPPSRSERSQQPVWMRWTVTILWNISLFLFGVMAAWVMFPRVIYVTVDPQTGNLIQIVPGQQANPDGQQNQNPDNVRGNGQNAGNPAPDKTGNPQKVDDGPRK
jgi:proteasome lid subunit RPN8/RPN11